MQPTCPRGNHGIWWSPPWSPRWSWETRRPNSAALRDKRQTQIAHKHKTTLTALHAKNPSPCGPLFIRAPPQHVVMTSYNLTFFMPLPTHVLRDRFPRGSTCNSDHENTIRLLESNRFSTYPTVMSEIICNTSRANRGCMHAQASSPTPFKVPLVTWTCIYLNCLKLWANRYNSFYADAWLRDLQGIEEP